MTSQSLTNPASNPETWFVTMKLIQVSIDQSCWDFSTFNYQILELDSQLTTFYEVKKENEDSLKEDTKVNRTITNLQNWNKILGNFS